MFGIGFQELLVILLICLLLFGAQKLPEIGRALGKAIREFKHVGDEPPQMHNHSSEKSSESSKTDSLQSK